MAPDTTKLETLLVEQIATLKGVKADVAEMKADFRDFAAGCYSRHEKVDVQIQGLTSWKDVQNGFYKGKNWSRTTVYVLLVGLGAAATGLGALAAYVALALKGV